MGEVVTFVDYRPPVRADGVPWTEVEIQEAAAEEEAEWVSLETLPLVPLDPDPATPAYRSFTTELGTALDYWYRIVFVDESGDTSQPTTPVQNTAGSDAAPPAVNGYVELEELFRVLRITSPTSLQQTAGQRDIDAAALEIDRELGRSQPYADPPALVIEVNLERAVEHWQQSQAPFAVLGLGEGVPTMTAKDSWERHAFKLAPLKEVWGLA